MRIALRLGLVVGLVAGACSGTSGSAASTAESSTAPPTSSYVSVAPTTSTYPTAAPPTTYPTLPPPTTSTTTIPVPDNGVIVSMEGVLGWIEAGQWITWLGDAPQMVPADEGDAYRIIGVDGPAGVVVGGGVHDHPTCGFDFTDIDVGLDPQGWPAVMPIAASIHHDPQPFPVEILSTDNPAYIQAVSELLAGQGVDDAEPRLTQVLRADIEGDGTDEVFITAQRTANELLDATVPGEYGVAIVRKVVEGEVQTAILNLTVVSDATAPFGLQFHRFSAIADLNDDGRLDIVLQHYWHNGSLTQIFDYVNDDLGPVHVMGHGCPAAL